MLLWSHTLLPICILHIASFYFLDLNELIALLFIVSKFQFK